MGTSSKYKSLPELARALQKKHPSRYWDIMESFLATYQTIIDKKNLDLNYYINLLETYGMCVYREIKNPTKFTPVHKAVRSPIDYYHVGNEIFRPLVNTEASTVQKTETIEKIIGLLKNGENVVLFANHQIEADPQAISILLDDKFPGFAENMMFVAGERVITDPMAIPFSMGRNLFCIYSKKYFDAHQDRKFEMLEHNKRTMLLLGQTLDQGGKCIYIAPSGGRDRPNENKEIEVAPFDPQSVELMYLLGRKAKSPTHFFPLALSTHHLLPPPEGVQVPLGEKRPTNEADIHLFFGNELNMKEFPGSETDDRKEKRLRRALHIWEVVKELYGTFPK